jgi:hypothetical protein
MYTGLTVSGRLRYFQLSHYYLSPVLLSLRLMLKSWKDMKLQVSMKFHKNCSKWEIKHSILRSTNLIILLGIRKNCKSSGHNILLYLYIRRVVKWTTVIVEECNCCQLHTKFYQKFFCQV